MLQTDTLKNGYKIIQDTDRFQFGIDAVLLADFAAGSVHEGDKVIDLGTGTGIIPLLMAGRWKSTEGAFNTPLRGTQATQVTFTGLEVQEASAEMAAQSVALNGLEKQIQIVHGDLKEAGRLFPRHSFNVVTCNPPYMIDEHGRGNALDAKTIARHEVLCTLEDVVAAADTLLATHGKFFMIHRPFRLPEIFSALEKHSMEMKRMRLIQPFAGKEPNMVLIEARKNAKRRLTIEPPLVVRNDNGEYTDEIHRIYGD
ncbi:tRNA1Val (adenine37-N6)-methyltransferase [Treponema bryantii]|uniref:tRNA1Val (Adenine37-N6)-methyltransferase n=1 Tax=Treponema bryantii TaxID=163 RepID=A0A1I3MND5_9SPIR|nr:tRNA1(Val) (adenine(37)-N6)-methyltransferase [Treponema bryantii]SFI98452.1 tRNA1Val (adenine37-N6)-methyltransferase [Treponema bryantii]